MISVVKPICVPWGCNGMSAIDAALLEACKVDVMQDHLCVPAGLAGMFATRAEAKVAAKELWEQQQQRQQAQKLLQETGGNAASICGSC